MATIDAQQWIQMIDTKVAEAKKEIEETIETRVATVEGEIDELRTTGSEQSQHTGNSLTAIQADLSSTQQNVYTMNATVSRADERTISLKEALSQSAAATEGLRTAVEGVLITTGNVRAELAELRESNQHIEARVGYQLWRHTLTTAGVAATLVSIVFAAFQIFGGS